MLFSSFVVVAAARVANQTRQGVILLRCAQRSCAPSVVAPPVRCVALFSVRGGVRFSRRFLLLPKLECAPASVSLFLQLAARSPRGGPAVAHALRLPPPIGRASGSPVYAPLRVVGDAGSCACCPACACCGLCLRALSPHDRQHRPPTTTTLACCGAMAARACCPVRHSPCLIAIG